MWRSDHRQVFIVTSQTGQPQTTGNTVTSHDPTRVNARIIYKGLFKPGVHYYRISIGTRIGHNMKSAPAGSFLKLAVGQEYNEGTHCWDVLDDLFDMWPHLIAGTGILMIAIASYSGGGSVALEWSVLFIALQLLMRAGFKLAYIRRSEQASLQLWLYIFWVAALMSGVLWGISMALMFHQASPSIQLMTLTVGCAIVQSATSRGYMAPLQSMSQAAALMLILAAQAVVDGLYLVAPLALLLMLFQIGQVRKLIELRVSELKSKQERVEAQELLAEKAEALERANAQLKHYAMTDELTGLPNRRKFDQRLARQLDEAVRQENCLSLALIDVDHFKQFNDTHGHLAGDACLTVIGLVMKEFADVPRLFAARYGGEEFALIMSSTDSTGAASIAEKLRKLMSEIDMSNVIAGAPGITISIGIATMLNGEPLSAEDLINRADSGLYEAKRSGRNRVRSGDGLKLSSMKELPQT